MVIFILYMYILVITEHSLFLIINYLRFQFVLPLYDFIHGCHSLTWQHIPFFFVKTTDQSNCFIPTLIEDHVIKIYTVEPPCATTFHKRPLIQNTKTFPVKALQLELLVNGHLLQVTVTTFWAWKFNDFPLFLTSCKRPLDAFSDLYVRYVHYATWNIPHVRKT